MLFYTSIFLAAFFLTLIFTWLTGLAASKLNIVDNPGGARKIHKNKTPLLGGLAIFLGFFIVIFLVRENLVAGILTYRHWLWFFFGACFLIIGGVLDDKYNLKPGKQIIWPLLAIACIIFGGIGIGKVTNPFGGGFLYITGISGFIFTIIWLLAMMYTTKLLDGMDGLVSGISAIGGLVIFLFTITTKYYQPDIALAALIFAAACLGFLVLNWHPAKIFLGEGGSLLLGYILGVLAIISGGKIAIALLVLGLPLLDFGWTILRRLLAGKNPLRFADRKHLHHRLLDIGLGQRQTVLIFYAFSIFFGLAGLLLQSRGKIIAIAALFLIMVAIILGLRIFDKEHGVKSIEHRA
jgi:UDP-GlcNAc:undecaprenyl-phosphate GlcNAc-1-phosphate transferase